jgi:hypothetical protein
MTCERGQREQAARDQCAPADHRQQRPARQPEHVEQRPGQRQRRKHRCKREHARADDGLLVGRAGRRHAEACGQARAPGRSGSHRHRPVPETSR